MPHQIIHRFNLLFLLTAQLCAIFQPASALPRIIAGLTSDPPYARGEQSPSPYRINIDLSGDWELQTPVKGFPKLLVLPSVWDGWSGVITLRRAFVTPADSLPRMWLVCVDGLSGALTLTVNGNHLESRRGWGVTLNIPIDNRFLSAPGQPNELLLTLDNNAFCDKQLPLRGGIYAQRNFGGISRGLHLTGLPGLAISDLDAHITPYPKGVGLIEVNGEVRCAPGSKLASFTTSIQVTDPLTGDVTALPSKRYEFPAAGLVKFTEKLAIERLSYWDRKKGTARYQVDCVVESGVLRDSLTIQSAIPLLRFAGDGFWRDGEMRFLRVLDIVGSFQRVPSGNDTAHIAADLRQIVELGVDAVRIAQASANPAFLNLCDDAGLLVFEELPVFQVPDAILGDADFIRSTREQLEAILQNDRQFTCIAGWGLGAEIQPPNSTNMQYYEQLIELVREYDKRPVYAVFPVSSHLRAAPLDFAMMAQTPYSRLTIPEVQHGVDSDRPIILGGIRSLVIPGNLGGYADKTSESGQAEFILNMVVASEKNTWAIGVDVGDLRDWEGESPLISGPGRGRSVLYTTGLIKESGAPRLAYNRLREYWASGRVEPLSLGEASKGRSGTIVVVGLLLTGLLLAATKQNNIFRMNLIRALFSPRNFFNDISERRYFQQGHTLLAAVLSSGTIALVVAAWLFSNRQSYTLDWILGHLIESDRLAALAAAQLWDPIRGILLMWLLGFLVIILAALRVTLISFVVARRTGVNQGLNFVVWSNIPVLLVLPLGVISERLLAAGWGFTVVTAVLLLLVFGQIRLISVLSRHFRSSFVLVGLMWALGPLILLGALQIILQHGLNLSDYWEFYWKSIN